MKPVSTVILNIPINPHTSIGELKERLSRLKGVIRVTVNPVTEKVTVMFYYSNFTFDNIRAAIVAGEREGMDDKETR